MTAPLALDLDGTLWDDRQPSRLGKQRDMLDPERLIACIPHETAVARVRESGRCLIFITGRKASLRKAVERKLATLDLYGDLYMQRSWMGYTMMTQYKAYVLRNLQPVAFVGDHMSDQDAARMAQVPFVHAHDWRDPATHIEISAEGGVLVHG